MGIRLKVKLGFFGLALVVIVVQCVLLAGLARESAEATARAARLDMDAGQLDFLWNIANLEQRVVVVYADQAETIAIPAGEWTIHVMPLATEGRRQGKVVLWTDLQRRNHEFVTMLVCHLAQEGREPELCNRLLSLLAESSYVERSLVAGCLMLLDGEVANDAALLIQAHANRFSKLYPGWFAA